MEKVETEPQTQVETKPQKPPKKQRVARCLECSNEWTASNGNEKKPSRCPLCKSRDVKWRDECTGNEIPKKQLQRTTNKPAPEPEPPKVEKVETPKQEPEEAPEEIPKMPEQKAAQTKPEPRQEPDEEFTYDDAKQAIPAFPMQGIVILLGLAAIAAAVFFLVRKGKISLPFGSRKADEAPKQQAPTPVRTYNLPGLGGGLA